MNLLMEGIDSNQVMITDQKAKVTIDGVVGYYDVYRVRLDLLYFNDKNARIATFISRYKNEHGDTIFENNTKEENNEIIHNFIVDSNPDKFKITKENIKKEGQHKYGIVLNDGRVIDGNRRFTCLRELQKEGLDSFNYFETIILNYDLKNNSKQIKKLELEVQIGEDSKDEYDPIETLVDIYTEIEETKQWTIDEYARSTNIKVSDLKKRLSCAILMVEFLDFINAHGQYYIAKDLKIDGPVVELYAILSNAKNDDEKQQIKESVFINLLLRPDGDMTRYIRKIKNIIKGPNNSKIEFLDKMSNMAEKLKEEINTEPIVNTAYINTLRATHTVEQAEAARILEKADVKSKKSEALRIPFTSFEKINEAIDDIDLEMVKKLPQNKIKELISIADSTYQKLSKLSEELKNV